MTERQKQVAIIGAVILVIIALMIWKRGGSQMVVNEAGELVPAGDVYIGGITFPERGAIIIPGLPDGSFSERLSAIGACCSDCSGSTPRQSFVPANSGPTFVYNAGSRGPNVYNNYAMPYVYPEKPRAFGTYIAYN